MMKKYLNIDELKKRTSLTVNTRNSSNSINEVNEAESCAECPKCKEKMNKMKHGNILIDKCEFCNGVWIKQGQLEYLCDNFTDHQIDQLNTIGKHKVKKKNYNNLFHFD